MFFSQLFLLKITTGKGIGRIYKYDQQNWTYGYPNTNFVIPPCYDTYIQTQLNIFSDSYVDANYVSSCGLDQNIYHNVNTDVKDNYDSKLFETTRKHNYNPLSFGNTTATTTTPQ